MASKETKQRTKRGVSCADYELFRRMVRTGKTTWKKLERAGKVKSPRARAWRQAEVLKEINGKK